MMWLFAALIVLAMGGVAMLAAGHGRPLAEADDSLGAPPVPRSRPLQAEDLRRVRFSLAVRGYRMSEVDALLSRLADERDAEQKLGPQSTQSGNLAENDPPS